MSHLPQNPSKSTIARNPGLFGRIVGACTHGGIYHKYRICKMCKEQFQICTVCLPKDQICGKCDTGYQATFGTVRAVDKVIRQSSKPKLNKTEQEFSIWLKFRYPDYFFTEQAITFQVANGVRYTPDFVLFNPMGGSVDAWEVKGKKRPDSHWFTDDSKVKIKVAARVFPCICWNVAWMEDDDWRMQEVLA